MYFIEMAALSRRSFIALSVAAAATGSASWAETALPDSTTSALAFDDTAALAAGDGVWRREAGQSWRKIAEAGPLSALATHPADPGLVYAGGADGLLRSDDGGRTWTEIGKGLPAAPITALAVAAEERGTVYAGVEGDGLWVSRDAGASWEFAMDRPYLDEVEHNVLTLASVDAATGMGGIWIYAGTAAGIIRVPDCFCRWQEIQSGDAMDALVAGEAPAPDRPLPEGNALVALSGSSEALYGATASAIWKSTDLGVNWEPVHQTEASALAVDPSDPAHVIAATTGGLIESQDAGQTWSVPSNS